MLKARDHLHRVPQSMRGRLLRVGLVVVGLGLGTACTASAPGVAPPPESRSASDISPAPDFVNRVWRVAESPTVTVGQLYVFLSDGTLVVTSGTSTPSLGAWRRDAQGFTMIEAGRAYKVDIVGLTRDEFTVHINDPGDGVDMRLVPADMPVQPPLAGR